MMYYTNIMRAALALVLVHAALIACAPPSVFKLIIVTDVSDPLAATIYNASVFSSWCALRQAVQ